MDKVLEQLEKIKDVEKRLVDLANTRGTPQNVATDLRDKATSLGWAHAELHKQFVVDSLLLVGSADILYGIGNLDVILSKDQLIGFTILFAPDKITSEPLLDEFSNPKKCDIPDLPDWIKCKNYRGKACNGDRAVIFECALLRQRLSEIGYKAAKIEICSWLAAIFPRIRWSDSGRISPA